MRKSEYTFYIQFNINLSLKNNVNTLNESEPKIIGPNNRTQLNRL